MPPRAGRELPCVVASKGAEREKTPRWGQIQCSSSGAKADTWGPRSSEEARALEIEFTYRDDRGRVSISCVPDEAPADVGKDEGSRGFPVCTATIDYPGKGYRGLFGWVQLVRSTDSPVGRASFEMDPLKFFEDSPAPYCWFGVLPTLFDAPSRNERRPMTWMAHSFLAATPWDRGPQRQVVPLLGFSWGFEIDGTGRITIVHEAQLAAEDWAAHIPFLRGTYPTWSFPPPDSFSPAAR